MDTKTLLIAAAAVALSLTGCKPDDIQPEGDNGGKVDPSVVETTYVAADCGIEWPAGASISILDGKFNRNFQRDPREDSVTFSGKCFREDVLALYPYDRKAVRDSLGVAITLPAVQKCADGVLPDSIYVASPCGNILDFKPVCTSVRFAIVESYVTGVTFSAASGEGIAGTVHASFDGSETLRVTADSSSVTILPSEGTAFKPGVYTFRVSSANLSSGYSVSISNLLQDAVINVVDVPVVLEAGRLLDLGVIDAEIKPVPGKLLIPIHFKKEDKLLDCSSETGTGAAWPFVETKGSSSNHAHSTVLHTVEGGFPIYFPAGEHYLNSKAGWQLYFESDQDYLEFPTFAKGRLVSVSMSFGTGLPKPSFVDENGREISGGERKPSVVAATLYEWNLEDTRYGVPVRMLFNRTGGCQIMQMNLTYEVEGEPSDITNSVVSVGISAEAGFGTGKATVRAVPRLVSGADAASMTCGMQYRDVYGMEDPVCVEVSPSDMVCSLEKMSCDQYKFRAWVCSGNGWRVYSDEIDVFLNAFNIDFWKDGAVNNPFTVKIPSGMENAEKENGREIVRTLSGTDVSVKTFVPEDGDPSKVKYYMDSNNKHGCRVCASGTMEPGMTYFKFPAVVGKALRQVVVTRGGGEGIRMAVCLDPSSPESAMASLVSPLTETLSEGVTSITCPLTCSATEYSLVFMDCSLYYISRIDAVYESSDVPPGSIVEEKDDPSADPSGVFDYSRLPSMGHPRVLIDRAGFDDIRTKVTKNRASNKFLSDVSDKIVGMADSYVISPVNVTYTFDSSNKRILTQSRSALKQLTSLAYAYRLTGSRKYLARSRKILAQVCAFPDWNESHFLDVAEMSLGVAIAYDWLYDGLDLEERQLIHNRLVEYGLRKSVGHSFHWTAGNWNQVCNCGMVASALAVYEKDKAVSAEIIEAAVKSNRQMMEAIYAPDGNYAEGYGYWGYGTGFQTLMMKMMETAFGHCASLEKTPGFLNTAHYMLFMSGPAGPFGYADGGRYEEEPMLGMWWFAAHENDPSLLCTELRLYKNGGYSDSDECRTLVMVPAIVKDFNVDNAASLYPSARIWSGGGTVPVAMVHTGWTFGEGDHYLGIKGGGASTSHAHMDAGSFVYDVLGQRWSVDTEHSNYANLENALSAVGGDFWANGPKSLRWDVMALNNYAHSTISINGGVNASSKLHPTDHDAVGQALITSLIETSTELGAVFDMSRPLTGQVSKATRTIKLVEERDLVIIDEITALPGLDAPVLWHMVTPANAVSSTAGVKLSSGGKEMLLKTSVSDPSITVAYKAGPNVRPAGWTARTWDEPSNTSIVGFEASVPAGKTVRFETTLTPAR